MLTTEESPHIAIKTCSTLRPKLSTYLTNYQPAKFSTLKAYQLNLTKQADLKHQRNQPSTSTAASFALLSKQRDTTASFNPYLTNTFQSTFIDPKQQTLKRGALSQHRRDSPYAKCDTYRQG
jgi:hypothetical protein